jgi:outer membrane protein insertion porin family
LLACITQVRGSLSPQGATAPVSSRAFSSTLRNVLFFAVLLLVCSFTFAQVPTAVADPPQQRTTPLSAVAQFQGLKVHDINFRGFTGLPDDHLLTLIPQKPGDSLDRAKVRGSIQALYATGQFASIQVEAQRTEQQEVSLVFIAETNYFNGAIDIEGLPKSGPSPTQLANASKLQLGELFTTEKVDQSLERMKKVLQDNGYFKASVTMEQHPIPETRQMNMKFIVDTGEQARVGDVMVEGDAGFSEGQVQDIAKLHPGDKVAAGKLQRALQRIRKKFLKQDRLEAQVAIVDRRYNADANTVDYKFHIDRGATVDIHAEGAKISERLLKSYVPIYEESAVDDDLLNEGRRNLRDYFQTRGYFDVTVDFKREPKDGHTHVVYMIDLGERHKLTEVQLEGNKYFSRELIRERMLVQPAGWLLSHGRFSQSLLARDVGSITGLYQANGFQQVKVTSQVKDNYQGDTGRMVAQIHIDEGPQARVNSLEINGEGKVSESDIRDLLTTIEGQPFSESNVATDRESLLNYYFNRGFGDVELDTSAKPHDGDATKLDVVYNIKEGKQVFLKDRIVGGLEHTKPHIVNREFQLKPGDPISQSAMLESQRKLYDLGIFNEVNMAVQNPEGQAAQKNVLYQFTEAKRYTFNYGFGIEIATGANQGQGTAPQGKTGVSPRVSFDVTRINFRGRDQSIIFKSRVGRLQQRVLLSFDSPRWFDLPNWRWTVTAFYDNSRDVNTFAAERIEGSTQLEQIVNKSLTVLYRFAYRRVRVDPNSFPPGFNPAEGIPLISKPVRVGIPSITLIRDRRDDPIDSTKGSYNTADVGAAASFFGSEANFSRLLIQNSTYHQFKKKYVLARSTRIGVESPWGSDANLRNIPLPERFFTGGGNSHRGFAINQAGPRDPGTGTPLGGNAMFVNSFELRLPPVVLPFVQQNLSFVVFHDMGNVFKEANDMWKSLFKYHQDNIANCKDFSADRGCDFAYVSHAIGTGIRYKTPIGPVRVDLGYNLNPPTFPIVTTTTALGRAEVLRRWNIFFSIGQTF